MEIAKYLKKVSNMKEYPPSRGKILKYYGHYTKQTKTSKITSERWEIIAHMGERGGGDKIKRKKLLKITMMIEEIKIFNSRIGKPS